MNYILINAAGEQMTEEVYPNQDAARRSQLTMIYGAMLGENIDDALEYLQYTISETNQETTYREA